MRKPFNFKFLETANTTLKLKENLIVGVGEDDEGPQDFIFVGDRGGKSKIQVTRRIGIALTPQMVAYVRLWYPSSRFISECVRRAPADLIRHFQNENTKEKRTGIKSRSIPFDVMPEAYEIIQSIPKRLRSAFVRACIKVRPSFSGRVLKDTKDMFVLIDDEDNYPRTSGRTKSRAKKKK